METICIHLGRSGVSTGEQIWNALRSEHCLTEDGCTTDNIADDPGCRTAYFHEVLNDCTTRNQTMYFPRACFVDIDHCSVSNAPFVPIDPLDVGDWKYLEAKSNDIEEQIRLLLEQCNHCKSIEITLASDERLSSNLITILLPRFQDYFGQKLKSRCFSIFDQPDSSYVGIQDMFLGQYLCGIVENSSTHIISEKSKIQQVYLNSTGREKIDSNNIHGLFAKSIISLSSICRFPGIGLYDITNNLEEMFHDDVCAHMLTMSFNSNLSNQFSLMTTSERFIESSLSPDRCFLHSNTEDIIDSSLVVCTGLSQRYKSHLYSLQKSRCSTFQHSFLNSQLQNHGGLQYRSSRSMVVLDSNRDTIRRIFENTLNRLEKLHCMYGTFRPELSDLNTIIEKIRISVDLFENS